MLCYVILGMSRRRCLTTITNKRAINIRTQLSFHLLAASHFVDELPLECVHCRIQLQVCQQRHVNITCVTYLDHLKYFNCLSYLVAFSHESLMY